MVKLLEIENPTQCRYTFGDSGFTHCDHPGKTTSACSRYQFLSTCPLKDPEDPEDRERMSVREFLKPAYYAKLTMASVLGPIENNYIQIAVGECDTLVEAASRLGMSVDDLEEKIKLYGIDIGD